MCMRERERERESESESERVREYGYCLYNIVLMDIVPSIPAVVRSSVCV